MQLGTLGNCAHPAAAARHEAHPADAAKHIMLVIVCAQWAAMLVATCPCPVGGPMLSDMMYDKGDMADRHADLIYGSHPFDGGTHMPHHLFFGCAVRMDARSHVIHPAAAARQWLEYMATEHTVIHPAAASQVLALGLPRCCLRRLTAWSRWWPLHRLGHCRAARLWR